MQNLEINSTAIIILNYKNYVDTINCINSIIESKNKDYQIIVVDNDSQNQSLEKINDEFSSTKKVTFVNDNTPADAIADILLIQSNINKGYAAGNNVGLHVAHNLGAKYLMVLNNDTLFTDDCLTILRNTLNNYPEAICTGPLLLKGDNTIDYNTAKRRSTPLDIFRLSFFGQWLKTKHWMQNYYYMKKYPELDHPIEVDIISGSCMLFKAERFAEIGFFDDNTFLYYEEAIIHEKSRAKGYKIILEPNAKVIHLGAQTTKNHSSSVFTITCEYDSLKLYLSKYRKLSSLQKNLLLFNSQLFIKAYTFKKKL